jgi:nucleotide-binding universal stress UspA family protein
MNSRDRNVRTSRSSAGIESGPAAQELLAAADGAAALVVGARGLGGFAGMVTGSVSQQVLRRAHCPVLFAH